MSEEKNYVQEPNGLPDFLKDSVSDTLGIKRVASGKLQLNGKTVTNYYCDYREKGDSFYREDAYSWAGSETIYDDGKYELKRRVHGLYGGHVMDETETYASKGGDLLSTNVLRQSYDNTYTNRKTTYEYGKDANGNKCRWVHETEHGTRTCGQGSAGKARLESYAIYHDYAYPQLLLANGSYTSLNTSSCTRTEVHADGSKTVAEIHNGKRTNEQQYDQNGQLKKGVVNAALMRIKNMFGR